MLFYAHFITISKWEIIFNDLIIATNSITSL